MQGGTAATSVDVHIIREETDSELNRDPAEDSELDFK